MNLSLNTSLHIPRPLPPSSSLSNSHCHFHCSVSQPHNNHIKYTTHTIPAYILCLTQPFPSSSQPHVSSSYLRCMELSISRTWYMQRISRSTTILMHHQQQTPLHIASPLPPRLSQTSNKRAVTPHVGTVQQGYDPKHGVRNTVA
jgi:hypothetical protein